MRHRFHLSSIAFTGAISALLCAVFAHNALGQSSGTPAQLKFDAADVHLSPPSPFWAEGGPMREGRYTLRQATMLDLITAAWVIRPDKVVGGPGWLDTDRFDIVGQAAPATAPASMPLMLRTLLADRFGLKVHEDKRPLPAFVLTTGKRPLLKAADGSGGVGCKWQYPDSPRHATSQPPLVCHNMTMEDLAAKLAGGVDNTYVDGPVVDGTGLKGKWDFSLSWTSKWQLPAAGADSVTLFEAIDRQLGLKLEPRDIPMDVLVVDRVNRIPTENLPGVEERLSPPSPEFEVANVKPTEPGVEPAGNGFEPGGRINLRGTTLGSLIRGNWHIRSDDLLVGAPEWLDRDRFDFVARMPEPYQAAGAGTAPVDLTAIRLMWQALLRDRFGMVYHNEDRPVNAYVMVADKPKLQRADPSVRADCKSSAGRLRGSAARVLTCRNITMDQFAAILQRQLLGWDLIHPLVNSTGIQGSWDFMITWNPSGPNGSPMGAADSGGPASSAGIGEAPDPTGTLSLPEALDKQLGVKLEVQKRVISVLVIDHINRKPTDN